jgi:hypothetical protein
MRRVVPILILISSLAAPVANSASAEVPTTATPGSRLWAARFDSRAAEGDGGRSVAISPDGRIAFVTGTS